MKLLEFASMCVLSRWRVYTEGQILPHTHTRTPRIKAQISIKPFFIAEAEVSARGRERGRKSNKEWWNSLKRCAGFNFGGVSGNHHGSLCSQSCVRSTWPFFPLYCSVRWANLVSSHFIAFLTPHAHIYWNRSFEVYQRAYVYTKHVKVLPAYNAYSWIISERTATRAKEGKKEKDKKNAFEKFK